MPALPLSPPAINLFGAKPPVVRDAKRRNPLLSQHAIDRRWMDPQIAGQFRDREQGRHRFFWAAMSDPPGLISHGRWVRPAILRVRVRGSQRILPDQYDFLV